MDPDVTWEEIIRLAEQIQNRTNKTLTRNYTKQERLAQLDDAEEIACRVQDLRNWLASGGYPPHAFMVKH